MSRHFTRRQWLMGSGATLLAGLAPITGLRQALFASEPGPGKLLVVLHLRGGCDGLNLLCPAEDPAFVEARASELRVATDGGEPGHRIAHADPGAPAFWLHNAAGALAELATANQLAFVHAAGLPDATRSHFVATDMIEHGVADGTALNHSTDGWMARLLADSRATAGEVPAVSVSAAPSGAWSGDPQLISVADLGSGLSAPGGAQCAAVLEKLYGAEPGMAAQAGRLTLQSMGAIDRRLPRDGQQKYVAYVPENGIVYEAAADFGRPLKTLAQLVKLDLGLRAATIDLGGWDTHEYQPGRFKNQVQQLSAGLGAFYNDLARYQKQLTVVVVTEFGRRLRSNRSTGTDHGRGSVMLVLGGAVRGGHIVGRWPGLKPEQLDEGVDLAVVNDYRQVFSEAIAHWQPRAPLVFPGFRPETSLNLFA